MATDEDLEKIADMHARGAVCSTCNGLFPHDHGYPVLCKECWAMWGEAAATDAGLQKADDEVVRI